MAESLLVGHNFVTGTYKFKKNLQKPKKTWYLVENLDFFQLW